jgi:hypothetical protein
MLAADGRFTKTGNQKGRHTMTEQNQTPDIPNDDAEGHIHRGTEDDTRDDDTEGHVHHLAIEDDTEDDTEGHVHHLAIEDDDTEGHNHMG